MRDFIWHKSLSFRLSLVFALTSLFIVGFVSFAMTSFLFKELNKQFQMRLEERTQSLSLYFSDLQAGVGEIHYQSFGINAQIDKNGYVVGTSDSISIPIGEKFSYPLEGDLTINNIPFRSINMPLTGFNEGLTLWVAMPRTQLVEVFEISKKSLTISLFAALLLSFAIVYPISKKMLAFLQKSARLADNLSSSSNLKAMPLPNRRDEVYSLIAAINRLLVRLDKQNKKEKKFLGQIVHELGAPLTVLKATLDKFDDSEIKKAALVTNELVFTTQDLMQLARGKIEMRLALHLIEVKIIVERLERLVPDTQYFLDNSELILCDPDRIVQALRNLLSNARRAAGKDGIVSLSIVKENGMIVFLIADDGPGLPLHLGEDIFEPFVSGSGSSGLGLSVARQIAILHGGNLEARKSEAGALFAFCIPDILLEEVE